MKRKKHALTDAERDRVDRYKFYETLPNRHGSVAECMKKWDARQANRQQQPTPNRIASMLAGKLARQVVVPLGLQLQEHFLAEAQSANPRLREWTHGAQAAILTEGKRTAIRETGSNSDWRKRSTFQRGILVNSWATCTAKVATLRLAEKVIEIATPRGYQWRIDKNGLHLLGKAGDYHPTASELLDATGDKCRQIVASLKSMAQTRRQAKRKQQQEKRILRQAERDGATVCLADSLRSGNCYAGSASWSERHGFQLDRHYKPSEILAVANGDLSRVIIVIATALRRHRQEMDRGYALLSEHVVR